MENYIEIAVEIIVMCILAYLSYRAGKIRGYLTGSNDRYEFFKKTYGANFIDILNNKRNEFNN